MERLKAFWYLYQKERILFICSNGDVIDAEDGQLIKETYRGQTYYRTPKTNVRISQKSIKNNAERCNVLI